MPNQDEQELGTYLWRGGEKLNINKSPDLFTARLTRGVGPDKVERSVNAEHRREITRQNLDLFSVESTERDAVMDQMRRSDDVEFASHVYSLEADPSSEIYLTDEITAQFKPEVSDVEIESLATEYGLELVKELPDAPRAYVFRVTAESRENPVKIANRLMETNQVLLCEPNISVRTKSLHVPADTLFGEQWHLHHTGSPFLSAGSHIDAVRAWDVTRGARSIVVAVADDSCDLRHDDFQGQGKVVAPRDFAGRDFDPLPELQDDNHGTACAGVAAAEENGRGVVGVAPGCALMPIRTSGFIDDNSIEDLCDWVIDNGASVLSCSWSAAARFFSLSLRMQQALRRAATVGRSGRGCVLVFAAGNENRPVDGTVNEQGWPNNQPSGPTRWLNGFASHEDVIAVSASTSLARKSAYSNWGQEISVCAPSNNARPSTFPRVTTSQSGRGVVTTDRVGPSGYDSSDHTRTFGGTSSACPTVAGVAALTLSANPDLTARQVKEILQSTADKIVDANPDPQLGMSLGDYDQNGHSQWFGFGKVNAFSAVTEAVRLQNGGAEISTFRQASTPGLNIPDNNATGVLDTINFTAAAALSSIKVTVNIPHTFIGDLRVTLIAPFGAEVVLHNRNGGNTQNLQRAFDLTTTPGLSVLTGRPIQGDWTLRVQDLAEIDVGRLDRWEIEIEGSANAVVNLEEAPGVAIPDNDPNGIERALTTNEAGQIKEIEVAVDITHTFIGDLSVRLVSPTGTEVTLHNRGGGDADNLIRTYATAAIPALGSLRGQPIRGSWKLKVADLEAQDVGKLNRWGLKITREG